jgi:RNA polymerase sigma-70 factor, ECF subfamily
MSAASNYITPQRPSFVDAGSRTSIQTDYELTQAVGEGSTSSIGTLYERHKPKVYALCLRMTGNTAEAEDLTQEVFVQLLRKAGSFRGESQFATWLHRFTVNHVLMYFRRTTRRRERFPYLSDETGKIASLTCSFGSQVVDRISLTKALASLPTGSRSIFLKFDVEGYNHEEIAEIFGCTVGNSKSQLHKARKKLRKLLVG